jgi:hypothetical protein
MIAYKSFLSLALASSAERPTLAKTKQKKSKLVLLVEEIARQESFNVFLVSDNHGGANDDQGRLDISVGAVDQQGAELNIRQLCRNRMCLRISLLTIFLYHNNGLDAL